MTETIDEQINRLKVSASNRKAADTFVVIAALVASITVLIPWLLGRWMLRDMLARPRAFGVYDVDVREDGWYFLSDWLAGCVAIAIVAGVFLVVRPWSYRVGSVVTGFVVLALALFVMTPGSVNSWNEAEGRSVGALATTAFPFGDEYYTCGRGSFPSEDGYLYQVHEARVAGSDTRGCNRVVIYRGWERVQQVDIPDFQEITDLEVSEVGIVTIEFGDGQVLTFPITEPPAP